MDMISEFPLFVFTTLGGLAAGAYVVSALFPNDGQGPKRPWLFPLVYIALLGVGLLGVLGHLGRPERFLLALSNPSSMIAEEAYWSIALGILMLVDLVLLARTGASPRIVRILAAVAGIGLTCIMGNAYFTTYGNPAWAAWPTLVLCVAGDLGLGAALFALCDGQLYRKSTFAIVCAVLAALAAAGMAAVGTHFAVLGLGMEPFAVGTVLALAGAACALLAWKGKLPQATAPVAVLACLLVAVVATRYAFYAASIL